MAVFSLSGGLRFGSGHLFAPRRLTLKDQSKQSPSSGFRPDFVGFLRPGTDVALCVVSAIALKSAFRRGVSGQFRPSLPRRVERSSARVLTGPTRALRSFSLTLS
ncbi:hypothetical protein B1F73_17815 [Pseudomonas syringae]|nr:hypothetical protein CCL13_11210 [Pseudomonas syringae]RXT65449.1 hypothetical protein B1F71_18020 [Pseudomonas syringae]RXT77900.1 hypothetical protein B1F77_09295 [Pseudomonas syringae]RXT93744.1 hypothetical protein B1F75_12575 [Pseudomonas syringae]RXT97847.1 hypothetical protein B1F73_17815 [Pseudomonas syringae]